MKSPVKDALPMLITRRGVMGSSVSPINIMLVFNYLRKFHLEPYIYIKSVYKEYGILIYYVPIINYLFYRGLCVPLVKTHRSRIEGAAK